MKIKIYAIGKIKDNYLKEGINNYLKKISNYANIEIIEVVDEPIKIIKDAEIEIAKNIEGKRILKLLKDNEYLIGLDLNKKELTSEDFAKYLNDKFVIGGSNISFVIGGSYGLSNELKSRCNDFITLSKMTFLHTMTRLILLEQIYRAFKINNNEVYHK